MCFVHKSKEGAVSDLCPSDAGATGEVSVLPGTEDGTTRCQGSCTEGSVRFHRWGPRSVVPAPPLPSLSGTRGDKTSS